MVSKKDIRAIAAIIAKQKDVNPKDGSDGDIAADFALFQIVGDLEDYFEAENGLFERNKFRVACGF